MTGTMRLQEWIHGLEMGAGKRYISWIVAVVGFIAVAVVYDFFCFHNMNNPEAMDAAQLARNIAQGKGFETHYVRPFSMYLTREHRADRSPLLKQAHTDISNPPVYPLVLAPLLAITPAPKDLATVKNFSIYSPDLFIAILNQALLGLGALLVFRLALGWFDKSVAWMSAVLFVMTELYWRFSVSGLSTILLMDLMLVLAWLMARFERAGRENASMARMVFLAAAIGVITAVTMLTRYSFGWLLLPVLIFVAICGAQRRMALTAVVFLVFAAVSAPWLIRNITSSGWAFGTATFAPLADTHFFPSDTLERSLAPQFQGLPGFKGRLFSAVVQKCIVNMREIVTAQIPRLGGSWLWAFFLVGLLVRFQNVGLSRLRWFVTGAIVLMVPIQACSSTHLSAEIPQVNSENLLVVFSPMALIFGVGLFWVLFDSWQAPTISLRYGGLAVFICVISLPMLMLLAPPRPGTISPPYYPPRIQQISHYLSEKELLMSDIPWAVAWYGERPCVSLTLDWQKDFYEVSDFDRTVNGLFVSTRTTDRKFMSSWFGVENRGWGAFLLHAFVRREVPPGFPLKRAPEGLFANGEILLMDRDRWSADRWNAPITAKKF